MRRQLLLTLAMGALLYAQAPDNTKTNQRDRNGGATADDQKMSKEERELAQKIRKSVYEDKTLSTYAHNVKILVQGETVTLKGPVRSEAERETVEQKAIAVAGAKNVVNQLDIAPEKK
jgi:hyperosmotically inducible periplasmic protein